MGFIGNLIRRVTGRGREETRSFDYGGALAALANIAGFDIPDVKVDERTACTVDAVWAALDVITSALLSLPVHVIEETTQARRNDHPAGQLLRIEPNDEMTPAAFITAVMMNALLSGRGYAFIEKRGARPVGLWPLPSRCTYPVRKNGILTYITTINGRNQAMRPDQVLDIPALTFDGINGLAPIVYLARELGLSIVATKYATKAFANGGQPGGIIETPPIGDEAQKAFVESWRRNYSGVENALKIAALPAGWKFTQNNSTPESQQLMEMRIHQVRVVARIFKVPPHKLQDLERAAFKNVEELNIAFRQDCIGPWSIRWEQECNRKLLFEEERPRLFVRFNLDSMLRADTATRYNAHNVGIQGGWLTRNEVRALENLPPIEGGDTPLQPLNMGPASPTGGGNPAKGAIEEQDAAPPPPPAPAPKRKMRSQEHTDLLADAARRVLTKEINAVRRAAKKHTAGGEAFRAWVDQFYESHRDLVHEAFSPVAAAVGAASSADAIADRHVAESRTAVVTAFTAGTLDTLLSEWSDARPAAIAAAIE